MNAARARRRWQAWRRYEDKHIATGSETITTPGSWYAYNEWVTYKNMRYWYPGAKRYRRLNRRTRKGARR